MKHILIILLVLPIFVIGQDTIKLGCGVPSNFTSENWANDNLIADDDRFHDWLNNNLTICNIDSLQFKANSIDFHNADAQSDNSAAFGDLKICDWPERGQESFYSFGSTRGDPYRNFISNWNSTMFGTGGVTDGRISFNSGNVNIATGNDAHVEGNRNAMGRKQYDVVDSGTDGGGSYYVISDEYGDQCGFHPHVGIDMAEYYPAGYQIDANGNVFTNTMNPASPADLVRAMHPYVILRGCSSETAILFYKITDCEYVKGQGTKIYYDVPTEKQTSNPVPAWAGQGICWAYSSYSAQVQVNGQEQGGNGQHSEGIFTSTYGYAAHSQGENTKAWGNWTHSSGRDSWAVGAGAFTHSFGGRSIGTLSTSFGSYPLAKRNSELVIGNDDGDQNIGGSQTGLLSRTLNASGAGWHAFPVFDFVENGSYLLDVQLIGYENNLGTSAAYKFCFHVRTGDKVEFSNSDVNAATDIIDLTGCQEFADGDIVHLWNLTAGQNIGGVSDWRPYYVINSTVNTIQVSTTLGGSPVDFTTQGTAVKLCIGEFDLIETNTGQAGTTELISNDIAGVTAGFHATPYYVAGSPIIRIDQTGGSDVKWSAGVRYTRVGN